MITLKGKKIVEKLREETVGNNQLLAIVIVGKSDLIDSKNDLDGMTNDNIAKVFKGDRTGFAPCTAEAVIEILKGYNIKIEGKHVVIVGRSMTVGRPLGMLL